MPYVKSIPIHSTVNRSIAYILNPEKTEDMVYTTALNCMANAKDAYNDMKMVYEYFSGKKYNAPPPIDGKGNVKAIHYIQSFDPNENITPEQAHQIAKAFARKTFGDDCQIVIATHLDKGHLHNHFILNSYSVSGKKFYDNQTTLKKVREYSDRVCLAFDIQPIKENRGQSKNIAYNEWEHKKRGTSWKQKIRLDIDRLIGSVKNIDELLCELELMGYSIKRGKYISIKAEGQQRFIRTKTLGEDYTAESLISRIRWRDVGGGITLNGEPAPLRSDYINIIDEVTQLAAMGKKVKRNVRRIENLASIQINQKIQQFSANLDKAKSDLEEAKANVAKPFGRAEELAEKLKRLEYVNAQLSTDKNDDEPIPVSDIPTENEPVQAASVVVAMPAPAYTADRVNPKPQTPTDLQQPKFDSGFMKRKAR